MSLLETRDLTYVYGEGTPFRVTALDGVNINIERGEIIAVIGHTGSGKSTLIQHLNALLQPTSGTVLFDGGNINKDKKTAYSIRFKVGLCFQYPEYQLFESTVYKDISFGPLNMKLPKEEIDKRVAAAMSFVGLPSSYLNKSPFDLSGGEKRRVAIAGILAMDPEVLILDEPTAGLDPRGKEQIKRLIIDYRNKTGKTVIVVSHSMEDVAELASRILVVNHGKIAMAGTVDEIFSRADEIISMGLNVPQVTEIFAKLRKAGIDLPDGVYTPQKAVEALVKAYGGNRK